MSVEAQLARRSVGFELFKRSSASVKHFAPVDFSDGIPRDRFGNRVISSMSGLAYLDRNGDPVKAAALVSREGEGFLRKNKGLLKPIEQALIDCDGLDYPRSNGMTVVPGLGDGLRLTRMHGSDGYQSDIFSLETGEEKVIVKKIQKRLGYNEFFTNQPYFNDMLQTQAVAQDLGNQLAELGVFMPTFLFATGQVCALRFEDGFYPDYFKVEGKLLAALDIVKSYIKEQVSKKLPVWKNVYLDEQVRIDGDSSNFIEKQDEAWF